MADVKIQIKVGGVEFSGEGDKEWIGKQLDKILAKANELQEVHTDESFKGTTGSTLHSPMKPDSTIGNKTLSTFLREKDATTNQNKKFLATAVWLEAKGKNRLTTSDVNGAIKDNSQKRLGNASDCLNRNVNKGYCEKDGKEFFVTQEGKDSLG